jgi:hypothetical protein
MQERRASSRKALSLPAVSEPNRPKGIHHTVSYHRRTLGGINNKNKPVCSPPSFQAREIRGGGEGTFRGIPYVYFAEEDSHTLNIKQSLHSFFLIA